MTKSNLTSVIVNVCILFFYIYFGSNILYRKTLAEYLSPKNTLTTHFLVNKRWPKWHICRYGLNMDIMGNAKYKWENVIILLNLLNDIEYGGTVGQYSHTIENKYFYNNFGNCGNQPKQTIITWECGTTTDVLNVIDDGCNIHLTMSNRFHARGTNCIFSKICCVKYYYVL